MGKKVFISATSIDLKLYVQGVERALKKSGYAGITMSDFGAQPDEPRRVSLNEVKETDYFIGLYARRYGYIPDNETFSITEQEYHHARKHNKPVFAFLVDETNTDLKPGPGEDDDSAEARETREKLNSFKARIETALVRETFRNQEDLTTKVLASLSRYEKRKTVLQPPSNTLRIELGENQCQLFHNDALIGTSPAAFDAAWRHGLDQYHRAKTSTPTWVTKAGLQPAGGAAELATDHMGQQLGGIIFPDGKAQTIKTLISPWQHSDPQGKPQVALKVLTEPWPRLPLETLRIPGEKEPLALTPYLDMFRMGPGVDPAPCPDIDGPLKVLMAVAVPWQDETQTVLDYENELGKVVAIAEQLPDFTDEQRRPIVHILDQGTLAAISDVFKYNRYHILHISCHGQPGALHLETEDGTLDTVTAEELVKRFPSGRQPVLTVLSACHTGAAGELTSFARHLVENGFSYVVAMQEAVSDTYATAFTHTLYKALAYDETPVIEAAFTQTRLELEQERVQGNRALAPEQHHPPEWMIPALYKNSVQRYAIFEPRAERYKRYMETPPEDFDPGISHR